MSRRCARSRATTAAALIGIAFLIAGCTSPNDDPSPPPSSATSTPTPAQTPTPTADPEVAAAEVAILDAYKGFWDAQVLALADPAIDPPAELGQFAVDKAFSGVGEALFEYRRQGIVLTGAPVLAPEVDSIVLGESPTAHVTDCVDSSDWIPIFRATGESAAAPGQAPRLVVESWAIVYDERWVIRETSVHRDHPC